jgi:hypothetical protein
MARRTKQTKEKKLDWRDPQDFHSLLYSPMFNAIGHYKRSFNRPHVLSTQAEVGLFVEERCTTGLHREYIQAAYRMRDIMRKDEAVTQSSPVNCTVTPSYGDRTLQDTAYNMIRTQTLPFVVCDPRDENRFVVFEVNGTSFIQGYDKTYWRSHFGRGEPETHITFDKYIRALSNTSDNVRIPAFYMQRENFDSDAEYESHALELIDFAKRYAVGMGRVRSAVSFVTTVFANTQTTRAVFKMFAGFQALCRMFEIPDTTIGEADKPTRALLDKLNTSDLRRQLPDWAESWLDHREVLSGLATVYRTARAEERAGNVSNVAAIESILYVGD